MGITQKALSLLLLTSLAFGSLSCPCPAEAASGAGSPGLHESHDETTSTNDVNLGCEHWQCLTECNLVSPEFPSEDAAVPCAGKAPLDDIDAVEAEIALWPGRARSAVGTDPPPHRLWLPHETPVRRFERLLD